MLEFAAGGLVMAAKHTQAFQFPACHEGRQLRAVCTLVPGGLRGFKDGLQGGGMWLLIVTLKVQVLHCDVCFPLEGGGHPVAGGTIVIIITNARQE